MFQGLCYNVKLPGSSVFFEKDVQEFVSVILPVFQLVR